MSSVSPSVQNKDLAKKTQSILAELGHPVSLGHAYELLSRLAGHASWNVAAAKGQSLGSFIESVDRPEDTVASPSAVQLFGVKITADATVKKYFRVAAQNEAEARAIIQEYIDIQCGNSEESEARFKETKKLLALEDDYAFAHDNWEVRDNDSAPEISEVYPPIEKLAANRWCYHAGGECDAKDGEDHYIPSIVYENTAGHFPVRGGKNGGSPYYWGTSLEQCQKFCDEANARMGLTPEDCAKIIASSMGLGG